MSVDVSPLPPGRFLSACSWCNSLCLAVFVCMSVYMCVCLYTCLYVRLFACLCLSVRLPGIQMLTEKVEFVFLFRKQSEENTHVFHTKYTNGRNRWINLMVHFTYCGSTKKTILKQRQEWINPQKQALACTHNQTMVVFFHFVCSHVFLNRFVGYML